MNDHTDSAKSLADLIVEGITDTQVNDIIATSMNEHKLSGDELHRTLVKSGAVLGVDTLQVVTRNTLNANMALIRSTLKIVDEQIVTAQGDDAMLEFATKLRDPLRAAAKAHLNSMLGTFVQAQEEFLGIDRKTLLTRISPREMDREEVLAAGRIAAFQVSEAFLGFLNIRDVASMECKCPGCLAKAYVFSSARPAALIPTVAKTHGNLESAMYEFGVVLIEYVQKISREFEEGFGDLDSSDFTSVDEVANSFFDRIMQDGGGKPH